MVAGLFRLPCALEPRLNPSISVMMEMHKEGSQGPEISLCVDFLCVFEQSPFHLASFSFRCLFRNGNERTSVKSKGFFPLQAVAIVGKRHLCMSVCVTQIHRFGFVACFAFLSACFHPRSDGQSKWLN